MSADDDQLPMIDVCAICGGLGVIASSVPTVETPTPHTACFTAAARWVDRAPWSPPPTPDARLRRRARRRWRAFGEDSPDLRVVS